MSVSQEINDSLKKVVERATHDLLKDTDWETNLSVCDILNNHPHATSIALKYLRPRLDHQKARIQYLAIDLLSTIVDNCPRSRHCIGEYEFLKYLTKTMPKSIRSPLKNHVFGGGPVTDVEKLRYSDRVLACIRRWAEAFRYDTTMPAYLEIYRELSKKGVKFPELGKDEQAPIFLPGEKENKNTAYHGSKKHNPGLEMISKEGLLMASDIKPIVLAAESDLRFKDSKMALQICRQVLEAINIDVLYNYAYLAHTVTNTHANPLNLQRPKGSGYSFVSNCVELGVVMREDITKLPIVARLLPDLRHLMTECRAALHKGLVKDEKKVNEMLVVNDSLSAVDLYIQEVSKGKVKRGSFVEPHHYDALVEVLLNSVDAVSNPKTMKNILSISEKYTMAPSGAADGHVGHKQTSKTSIQPVAFAPLQQEAIPAVIIPGVNVAVSGGQMKVKSADVERYNNSADFLSPSTSGVSSNNTKTRVVGDKVGVDKNAIVNTLGHNEVLPAVHGNNTRTGNTGIIGSPDYASRGGDYSGVGSHNIGKNRHTSSPYNTNTSVGGGSSRQRGTSQSLAAEAKSLKLDGPMYTSQTNSRRQSLQQQHQQQQQKTSPPQNTGAPEVDVFDTMLNNFENLNFDSSSSTTTTNAQKPQKPLAYDPFSALAASSAAAEAAHARPASAAFTQPPPYQQVSPTQNHPNLLSPQQQLNHMDAKGPPPSYEYATSPMAQQQQQLHYQQHQQLHQQNHNLHIQAHHPSNPHFAPQQQPNTNDPNYHQSLELQKQKERQQIADDVFDFPDDFFN